MLGKIVRFYFSPEGYKACVFTGGFCCAFYTIFAERERKFLYESKNPDKSFSEKVFERTVNVLGNAFTGGLFGSFYVALLPITLPVSSIMVAEMLRSRVSSHHLENNLPHDKK